MVITKVAMLISGHVELTSASRQLMFFAFAFYRLVTVCMEDTEPIKHLCNLNGHSNNVSQQETLIFLILTRGKIVYFFHRCQYFLEIKTLQPFEILECNVFIRKKDKLALFCLSACFLSVPKSIYCCLA